MAIGINITNNVTVTLGEIKEQLLSDLDTSGIKYAIMFDKINKQNIKETIIAIDELGMEISVENDIITYIKSDNNKFTHLDKIENIEDNPLEHVKAIKQHILRMFNCTDDKLKLEQIDIKTMNIVVIIASEIERARITILREGLGNVYVNTLRQL